MTRRAETHFGSFRELLGTPVYAKGWWFFRASDVALEGGTASCHDLRDYIGQAAADGLRPAPPIPTSAWLDEVAPIGLGFTPPTVLLALPMGFVAVKTGASRVATESIDVAYPFLLVEREQRIALAFSAIGPELTARESIVLAFCRRLLWRESWPTSG